MLRRVEINIRSCRSMIDGGFIFCFDSTSIHESFRLYNGLFNDLKTLSWSFLPLHLTRGFCFGFLRNERSRRDLLDEKKSFQGRRRQDRRCWWRLESEIGLAIILHVSALSSPLAVNRHHMFRPFSYQSVSKVIPIVADRCYRPSRVPVHSSILSLCAPLCLTTVNLVFYREINFTLNGLTRNPFD